MGVKTITLTEDAYKALKSLKSSNESFSDTILRVAGKKSLREFVGILSKDSADRLEKELGELRRHNK